MAARGPFPLSLRVSARLWHRLDAIECLEYSIIECISSDIIETLSVTDTETQCSRHSTDWYSRDPQFEHQCLLSISPAFRAFSMCATRNVLADLRATEVNQDPWPLGRGSQARARGQVKVTAQSLQPCLGEPDSRQGSSFAQRPRPPSLRSFRVQQGRAGARSVSPPPPPLWRKRRS